MREPREGEGKGRGHVEAEVVEVLAGQDVHLAFVLGQLNLPNLSTLAPTSERASERGRREGGRERDWERAGERETGM